jgi:hypothetical protein
VSELRYGALVAGWGEARRNRLDESIEAITVVPVSDRFLSTLAELRFACRRAGHPLHDRAHANDLWIATSALHERLLAEGNPVGPPDRAARLGRSSSRSALPYGWTTSWSRLAKAIQDR